jgi:uncharacterized protein (DUF433 family)
MNSKELELLGRITMNLDIANRKPLIQGTTVTVEEILNMMGDNISIPDIPRHEHTAITASYRVQETNSLIEEETNIHAKRQNRPGLQRWAGYVGGGALA